MNYERKCYKNYKFRMNRYLNNYQMSKLNEVLYKRLDLDEEEISNEEYLNKFINSKRLEGCSNLTLKNYTIHVSKLFNYLNKDIRTMDTEDLRNYLSYYQSKNNCNNLTIDGVRRSLSSFFSFLEVEDYIVKSPVRRIHKIKTDILVKETYADEVLEKLRNNCNNIRNLAIIDLLASSGVRISELVNLNKVPYAMKVLSLIEPWATLIKEGKKVIETRSWKTSYRGELYIHASNKKIKRSDAHTRELLKLIPNVPMGYGNIICKCRLVDCVYMDQEFLDKIQKDKQEFLCGEYSLGRYAWILEDVEVLENPIPAKGHLNIWNYEVDE